MTASHPSMRSNQSSASGAAMLRVVAAAHAERNQTATQPQDFEEKTGGKNVKEKYMFAGAPAEIGRVGPPGR